MLFSIGTSQIQRWVYHYNGPANSWDEAYSLVYGADENIYIAGYSQGIGSYYDFTVISLTSTGSPRWIYRDNGAANDADRANSLVYGADGNVYVAGMSIDIDTTYGDFTVISLTAAGNRRWVYRYNGPGNYWDEAYSLVYGADGNIYIAGYSTGSNAYSNFTVISLTSTGSQRWVYWYSGPANTSDGAYSLVYGQDGNIYIAGQSLGSGYSSNSTVISLTSAGAERWVYQYYGPSGYNYANSLVYGADGNIYIAGNSFSGGTNWDFTVISLTSAGTERWVYPNYGPGNAAYSLVYGLDGNIYSAGISTGSDTSYDFTVISLTSTGTERWVYRYNGPGNGGDWAFSLVYGADGNIYSAGATYGIGTSYDFTVISLTSTGTYKWAYRTNGPGNSYDCANSLVYGADGNIYVAGKTYDSATYDDFTVISLNPAIGIEEERMTLDAERFTPEIYPNPAKSEIRVRCPLSVVGARFGRLRIFDVSGKLVKEIATPVSPIRNDGEEVISLKGINPGIYFLRFGTEIKKFLVIK